MKTLFYITDLLMVTLISFTGVGIFYSAASEKLGHEAMHIQPQEQNIKSGKAVRKSHNRPFSDYRAIEKRSLFGSGEEEKRALLLWSI